MREAIKVMRQFLVDTVIIKDSPRSEVESWVVFSFRRSKGRKKLFFLNSWWRNDTLSFLKRENSAVHNQLNTNWALLRREELLCLIGERWTIAVRRLWAFSSWYGWERVCSYLTNAVPSGGPPVARVVINKVWWQTLHRLRETVGPGGDCGQRTPLCFTYREQPLQPVVTI